MCVIATLVYLVESTCETSLTLHAWHSRWVPRAYALSVQHKRDSGCSCVTFLHTYIHMYVRVHCYAQLYYWKLTWQITDILYLQLKCLGCLLYSYVNPTWKLLFTHAPTYTIPIKCLHLTQTLSPLHPTVPLTQPTYVDPLHQAQTQKRKWVLLCYLYALLCTIILLILLDVHSEALWSCDMNVSLL